MTKLQKEIKNRFKNLYFSYNNRLKFCTICWDNYEKIIQIQHNGSIVYKQSFNGERFITKKECIKMLKLLSLSNFS